MRKATARSKKSNSRREVVDRSATTDVITQLECAVRHPQAALLGALVGGIVPWFARTLAHEQVPAAWSAGQHSLAAIMIAVVLGCACFSAISVYKFGRAAFGDSHKALGFVLALEGVMLVSRGTTSMVALGILIAINAIANGSVIALARDATQRRCEADVRRAATRARTRADARCSRDEQRADVSVVTAINAETAAEPRRAARPARTPGQALVASVWRRPTLSDDVIDAEIVSEQRLLS